MKVSEYNGSSYKRLFVANTDESSEIYIHNLNHSPHCLHNINKNTNNSVICKTITIIQDEKWATLPTYHPRLAIGNPPEQVKPKTTQHKT